VIIFCSGRVGDADTLVEILNLFSSAMRMQLNIQKSTLTTLEMGREEEETYKNFFPYTAHDILEGLKYLGFPLKPNNYRKEDWKWLLAKLEKKLKFGASYGCREQEDSL
jgi:hypothetical protein